MRASGPELVMVRHEGLRPALFSLGMSQWSAPRCSRCARCRVARLGCRESDCTTTCVVTGVSRHKERMRSRSGGERSLLTSVASLTFLTNLTTQPSHPVSIYDTVSCTGYRFTRTCGSVHLVPYETIWAIFFIKGDRMRRNITIGVSVALVSAALSGCGSSPEGVRDAGASPKTTVQPVTQPPTTAPTPTKTTTAEQDAVLKAYRKWYEECVPAAQADPLNAQKHLKPCAANPQLDATVQLFVTKYSEGKQQSGTSVLNPQETHLAGDTAVIRDCMDDSAVKVKDVKTGKVLFTGNAKESTTTELEKINGTWFVVGTAYSWERGKQFREEFCTP